MLLIICVILFLNKSCGMIMNLDKISKPFDVKTPYLTSLETVNNNGTFLYSSNIKHFAKSIISRVGEFLIQIKRIHQNIWFFSHISCLNNTSASNKFLILEENY